MTSPTGAAAALVATVLVLAGCGDGGRQSIGSTPRVSGTTYVVTGVTDGGAPHALVDGTQIRLQFQDDRLVVTAGCNTMTGSYRLDGSRVRVGPLTTTDLGCDPGRSDQDTWVAGLLHEPLRLRTGTPTTLTSGETVLTLADRRVVSPDRPLDGTFWVLDTLTDGEVATSVPKGVTAYVRIHDGSVEVYDGCNAGTGPARVSGDRIVFGDRLQTLRACLGDRGQVANALSQVLRDTTTYRIEEQRLTVTRGDRAASFRAVDGRPTHD